MKVQFKNNDTILSGVTDFNLTQTFDCGQCFRWSKIGDSSYSGIAHGKYLKISADGNNVILHNTSAEEYYETWEEYFDISRDYSDIKRSLSNGEVMVRAIKSGGGIRILKQDLWETTISFIISASNNIPRIKKIIELLCENFGDHLGDGNYSFPTPQKLSGITADDLSVIRAGFRGKYIADAVLKVNSGEVDIYNLHNLDTQTARNELLKINGVGNKVADCILLFGLGRTEVFPVDTWINNVMRKIYPERCKSLSDVRAAGPAIFGNNCGIAQQYLFYYARENGGNILPKGSDTND